MYKKCIICPIGGLQIDPLPYRIASLDYSEDLIIMPFLC